MITVYKGVCGDNWQLVDARRDISFNLTNYERDAYLIADAYLNGGWALYA